MNHPSRFARGLALSVFIAAGLTAAYWGHGRSGRSGVDTAPADRPTSTAAVARGPPILALSDVMRTSGFEFTYDNGRAAGRHVILECLGGGVGTFDYDGDGRWDLFCPGGGQYRPHGEITGLRSALFRNLGDWKFEPVTAPSGAARAPYYTHGCCAGDFNSDGFTDVLVTGYGGLQLFQNQGDGRFIEVREQAGLFDDSWITSAAWGDLNGDGHPDLYLAHYVDWLPAEGRDARDFGQGHAEVCLPRRFNPLPDAVYYSNGDGTFRDATSAAGFVVEPSICGKGLGVVLGDVDLDGDVDVYVANDTDPNFLYLNQGSGVFQEVGLLHGAACDAIGKPTGSMGVDLGDYDGDGLPDIFVSNFENETFSLYRNEGAAHFLHVSQATGIMALGRLYVGWGTLFADVDRDGDEDLVVSNGHVFDFSGLAPNKQEPLLLMNERGQFVKAAFPP
ncbi:MAG TPA: VCBS repeat-containing protein, partial [Pirellulales bacterium]|nr:VCBS repeat-containing protein [Pirellulales bacterium]